MQVTQYHRVNMVLYIYVFIENRNKCRNFMYCHKSLLFTMYSPKDILNHVIVALSQFSLY